MQVKIYASENMSSLKPNRSLQIQLIAAGVISVIAQGLLILPSGLVPNVALPDWGGVTIGAALFAIATIWIVSTIRSLNAGWRGNAHFILNQAIIVIGFFLLAQSSDSFTRLGGFLLTSLITALTVYGIIAQSDGHIDVLSEPGKGSVFTLFLPRAEKPEPAKLPGRADGEARHGTETILVVEDEDVVRNLISHVLELHGYTILAARNGSDALDIRERHNGSIDIAVIDLVMPGLLEEIERGGNYFSAFATIYNIGKTIIEAGRLSLVDHFVDILVRSRFCFPEFTGIASDWSVMVNSSHLENIRTWLRLIEINPPTALIAKAEERTIGRPGPDILPLYDKIQNWEAMKIVLEAGIRYAERYARLARIIAA
mgnify:CR=1 FL=1